MADSTTESGTYDLRSADMPHLTGLPLTLVVELLESPLRGLLAPSLLRNAGLTWFRQQQFETAPVLYPLAFAGRLAREEERVPEDKWPGPRAQPGPGFRFATVHDYARAYRAGEITPEEVAHQLLAAIAAADAADPPLRAFIAVDRGEVLRQASDSVRRFQEGAALSVWDGVPVAIKDELDMVPYPTTLGTSFLGNRPAAEDATPVARLRSAGALLIGKANMHEIGIGMTGLNPHHGSVRNPYGCDRCSGGSSSGPAAAVAAGFCPVAIGADGGGSIRAPAAFCGVVGLKPTFGRVSEHGAAPVAWSVNHVGPLAATVTDAALAYAAIAGADPRDLLSCHQPPPTLAGWDRAGLSDLTLGVCTPWFRHATSEVVAACQAMLEEFKQLGATVREVAIPNLEAGRVAHLVTIAGEMSQVMDRTYAEHRRDHGLDVRLNLALARLFTTRDYIKAQQVRAQMMANLDRVLAEVDAILTPTTALAAPVLSPAALPEGESDLSTLTEIMRFTVPANLTGLPAISFPVGYNEACLPIGMQAMGRAWQEPTLLRLALAAEGVLERRPPEVFFPLLGV